MILLHSGIIIEMIRDDFTTLADTARKIALAPIDACCIDGDLRNGPSWHSLPRGLVCNAVALTLGIATGGLVSLFAPAAGAPVGGTVYWTFMNRFSRTLSDRAAGRGEFSPLNP